MIASNVHLFWSGNDKLIIMLALGVPSRQWCVDSTLIFGWYRVDGGSTFHQPSINHTSTLIFPPRFYNETSRLIFGWYRVDGGSTFLQPYINVDISTKILCWINVGQTCRGASWLVFMMCSYLNKGPNELIVWVWSIFKHFGNIYSWYQSTYMEGLDTVFSSK